MSVISFLFGRNAPDHHLASTSKNDTAQNLPTEPQEQRNTIENLRQFVYSQRDADGCLKIRDKATKELLKQACASGARLDPKKKFYKTFECTNLITALERRIAELDAILQSHFNLQTVALGKDDSLEKRSVLPVKVIGENPEKGLRHEMEFHETLFQTLMSINEQNGIYTIPENAMPVLKRAKEEGIFSAEIKPQYTYEGFNELIQQTVATFQPLYRKFAAQFP